MSFWNVPCVGDAEHLFEVGSCCSGISVAETQEKQLTSSLQPFISEIADCSQKFQFYQGWVFLAWDIFAPGKDDKGCPEIQVKFWILSVNAQSLKEELK